VRVLRWLARRLAALALGARRPRATPRNKEMTMNRDPYVNVELIPVEPEPEDEGVIFTHMLIGEREAAEILRKFEIQKKKNKQFKA